MYKSILQTAVFIPIVLYLKTGEPEPFIKPLHGEPDLRESNSFPFIITGSNECTLSLDS